jgi:hypothetical protein
VDEQRAPRLEADDQVLAAALESPDPLALKLDRHRQRILGPRQPRIEDLDALEAPALEQRAEPARIVSTSGSSGTR